MAHSGAAKSKLILADDQSSTESISGFIRNENDPAVSRIRSLNHSVRLIAIRRLLAALDELDFDSIYEFSETITYVRDYCGLSAKRLASEFKTSESTISRWVKGMTSPHPFARDAVRGSLHRILDAEQNSLAGEISGIEVETRTGDIDTRNITSSIATQTLNEMIDEEIQRRLD
ncbi:MAG: hypothetical protein HOE83_13865 [Alphaproteobacteria bacterium]|jgi:transcriptional regulator with XRE-family HTH domain|nr:hypothetical protein [Alphaproteobacteria bacterium]MBT4084867.1 hypothetical protein [Alphaproteobacteria bacterium]